MRIKQVFNSHVARGAKVNNDMFSLLHSRRLERENTLTKFPSIPTFHRLQNGVLTDEVAVPEVAGKEIVAAEKIDGINLRIAIGAGTVAIGTRENYIFSSTSSIVCNRHIVEALLSTGVRVIPEPHGKQPVVVYGELFGKKFNGGSVYSKNPKLAGFRVFAVREIGQLDTEKYLESDVPLGVIAAKRERWELGIRLLGKGATSQTLKSYGVFGAEPVPLLEAPPLEVGMGLEETYQWMNSVVWLTNVPLDDEPMKNRRAEGLVVHVEGTNAVAKLRFADYERALRRRGIEPSQLLNGVVYG